MTEQRHDLCWLCRERPREVAHEHSPSLASLCSYCDRTLTQPYAQAWQQLSTYLHGNWNAITRRGSFDLSTVFNAHASAGALHTHLHFVKLLGSKIVTEKLNLDVASFSAALTQGLPHPEITLLVAHCGTEGRKLLYYESDVSVLKRDDEVYSAVWMHLAFPIAVKVCYLSSTAPVVEPEGFPWHPTRQRKIVKISPYKGDTRPMHARRDLRL